MFICGSGSFVHQDEDENEPYNSPVRTPKRSKRQTFSKIIGRYTGNKNPYADRGLDKFNALLADLDSKKQQIYTQMNPEEISFVRFVYTNDKKDAKPIVVRVKDKIKQEDNSPQPSRTFSEQLAGTPRSTRSFVEQLAGTPRRSRNFVEHLATSTSAPANISDKIQNANPNEVVQTSDQILQPGEKIGRKKRGLRCNGRFSLENLKRPQIYFPVMMLMILLFLAISGRVFSILCTSIGWFLIPTVIGGSSPASSSSTRNPKRKKEYVKKLSEKKIVRSEGPSSPTSVLENRLTDDDQNQPQGHRRNW